MGEKKYMVRIIRAGKVFEIIRFPVSGAVKPRMPKSKGSLPRKQDANERQALKRLARLINANFRPGDLLLTLSIDKENYWKIAADDINGEREKAAHLGKLFISRVKRQLTKTAGVDPKYILVASDMDGDTGEIVRGHIHLLITAVGFTFEDGELMIGEKNVQTEIWKNGKVDIRPLWHQDDYTPIAEYLLKQVRRIPDKSKYSPSRNLAQPELVEEYIEYGEGEVKAPRNGRVLQRAEYIPGQTQYLRYFVKSAKGPKPVKRRIKRQNVQKNSKNGQNISKTAQKRQKMSKAKSIKRKITKTAARAGGKK